LNWRLAADWCGNTSAGMSCKETERKIIMLYTIAVILLVLWALGLVTSYTMGGFVHILLVVALVMILANFFSRRRHA
jgi:Family of unknown function (DUF5670)